MHIPKKWNYHSIARLLYQKTTRRMLLLGTYIVIRTLPFTNYKIKCRYFSKTRKVRSLCVLKDPVIHKVTCSCSEFYVGDTKRNSEVRWKENCSTKKTSEVGDHLLLSPGHTVNWEISTNRPGVGGGMGEENCGQILNVIFRNLHPYWLSNG